MGKKIVWEDNTLKKYMPAIVSVVFALLVWLLPRKKKTITAYGVASGSEITPNRAAMLAEVLFDAMKSYGTDEKAIAGVYDELYRYDKAILQVHEAFGLQSYNSIGTAPALFGVKLNLRQWLKRELNDKQFANWEMLYNKAIK